MSDIQRSGASLAQSKNVIDLQVQMLQSLQVMQLAGFSYEFGCNPTTADEKNMQAAIFVRLLPQDADAKSIDDAAFWIAQSKSDRKMPSASEFAHAVRRVLEKRWNAVGDGDFCYRVPSNWTNEEVEAFLKERRPEPKPKPVGDGKARYQEEGSKLKSRKVQGAQDVKPMSSAETQKAIERQKKALMNSLKAKKQ